MFSGGHTEESVDAQLTVSDMFGYRPEKFARASQQSRTATKKMND
jgi:hypothetical protein